MSDKKINASWIKSNLLTLFYALVIAMIIRTFLIQPFFIPSSSMEQQKMDQLFLNFGNGRLISNLIDC